MKKRKGKRRHVSKKEYHKYLKSKTWAKKRKRVLKRDNNKCFICARNKNLHVHHLTYDRVYQERLCDLVTLCDECHINIHKEGPNFSKELLEMELKDKPL